MDSDIRVPVADVRSHLRVVRDDDDDDDDDGGTTIHCSVFRISPRSLRANAGHTQKHIVNRI